VTALTIITKTWHAFLIYVTYYESIKRELKRRPIYECRCDERLKTKAEEFTRLAYTGLLGGLQHLKIKTRLIDEKIANARRRRPRGGSGSIHGQIAQAELLKLQKNGQFPVEPVSMKV
jgi:hypothetical protein